MADTTTRIRGLAEYDVTVPEGWTPKVSRVVMCGRLVDVITATKVMNSSGPLRVD